MTERSVCSGINVFMPISIEDGVMDPIDIHLFREIFDTPESRPHAFIYVRCDPDTCLKRLRLRGRKEENDVNIDFMRKVHSLHEKWIFGTNCSSNMRHGDVVADTTYNKKVLILDGALTDMPNLLNTHDQIDRFIEML
jgi:deoxyadenosine/deoxycytidine kinase